MSEPQGLHLAGDVTEHVLAGEEEEGQDADVPGALVGRIADGGGKVGPGQGQEGTQDPEAGFTRQSFGPGRQIQHFPKSFRCPASVPQ